MCYMNCQYENWAGDCRKPRGVPCPVEEEERAAEEREAEEREKAPEDDDEESEG